MPRIRSCLGWSKAYDDLNTKESNFADVRLKTTSAMALEGLRDLTSLRKAACAKPPLEEVSFEERVGNIEAYLRLLNDLVRVKEDLVEYTSQGLLPFMRRESNPFRFEWTIPQSSTPNNFQFFDRLEPELAMVLLLYAAAIRQQADASVLRTCESADEESEEYVSAVKLFQKVAGILSYISDYVIPQEPESSRKAEENIGKILRAMSSACLGEAQAVFASRAEAKKLSPKLIASIHLGASELFEIAASELKPNSSQVACQGFRMFLALSSELHQARARIQIAAWQSAEGKPGASCADLIDARKRLQDAKLAAETQERWGEIIEEELSFIEQKLEDYNRERSYVSMERVAPQRSAAPPAKISVKLTPYVPDKMTVDVFSSSD